MKKYIWLGLAVMVLGLSGCTLVKYENVPNNDIVDNQGDISADEAAINQLFIDKYPTEADRPEVKIETLVGDNARGSLVFKDAGNAAVSGAYFFAAKVDDIWEIVLSGNGVIDCTILAPYNFPSDMTADCAA
ncbi:hypothetical protein KKE14_02570 [Patescibacteria group bacterium]|nr:hypothetical protein [Patescibacteria group bacterium]